MSAAVSLPLAPRAPSLPVALARTWPDDEPPEHERTAWARAVRELAPEHPIRIALEAVAQVVPIPFRAPPSPSDFLEIAKTHNTRVRDAAKRAPKHEQRKFLRLVERAQKLENETNRARTLVARNLATLATARDELAEQLAADIEAFTSGAQHAIGCDGLRVECGRRIRPCHGECHDDAISLSAAALVLFIEDACRLGWTVPTAALRRVGDIIGQPEIPYRSIRRGPVHDPELAAVRAVLYGTSEDETPARRRLQRAFANAERRSVAREHDDTKPEVSDVFAQVYAEYRERRAKGDTRPMFDVVRAAFEYARRDFYGAREDALNRAELRGLPSEVEPEDSSEDVDGFPFLRARFDNV